MSASTLSVLDKHLGAFAEGIDAVMADYTDESVLIAPDGVHRGLAGIEAFFHSILDGAPDGFWEAFTVTRKETVDDVAYLAWEGRPWYPMGTDTFVIRDGKIIYQTFASYAAE